MNANKDTVTCSFSMDRAVYNGFKSIVAGHGENVKGNLVRYMQNVIRYGTSNPDTILAMQEVDEMLEQNTGPRFHTIDALFEELNR